VQLVGGTDPARGFTRRGESFDVVVASLVAGELDAVVIMPSIRDGKHRLENLGAELVADSLLEHISGVCLADAVLDDVVQNPRNDDRLITAIPRQDDRDVGWMREVGQSRALPHLLVVMLGRECEGVIDAVRVPGEAHEQDTRLHTR